MVDTAKENTSPTGHCHSPLTRDTSLLSASAVFALLHAPPDASRSHAGRETSNAPPALVVQASTHRRVQRRVSPPLCRPHAPTQAAAAPAVRPAARRPLSSAATANPLKVPRQVLPPLIRQHAPSAAFALLHAPTPSCSRAGREASSAPPAFVGRRSNPSQGAASTPHRVPRRVPPPLIRQHAPTQAAAALRWP